MLDDRGDRGAEIPPRDEGGHLGGLLLALLGLRLPCEGRSAEESVEETGEESPKAHAASCMVSSWHGQDGAPTSSSHFRVMRTM